MLWKVMTSVINGFERRIIKSPFETPSMQNRWLKVVANIYQFLNKIEHHFVLKFFEMPLNDFFCQYILQLPT